MAREKLGQAETRDDRTLHALQGRQIEVVTMVVRDQLRVDVRQVLNSDGRRHPTPYPRTDALGEHRIDQE
jgi:hypothetical protein